jgi:hypothetical protein
MRQSRFAVLPVAVLCLFAAGCDLLNNKKDSPTPTTPTAPSSPSVTMNSFAGTWASVTVANPATGCGNVKYTVTPLTSTSANVQFNGTCAGNITVSGTGTGTLSGDTLTWSATGLVGQGGVNCPFSFTNSKATQDSGGQLVVTYSGTVCGIPVSGTETVKK